MVKEEAGEGHRLVFRADVTEYSRGIVEKEKNNRKKACSLWAEYSLRQSSHNLTSVKMTLAHNAMHKN